MFIVPFLFFFNDTATTEIYTLSLHDALPISQLRLNLVEGSVSFSFTPQAARDLKAAIATLMESLKAVADRKSTRLNSSHANISYAVFCLKKKKTPDLDIGRPGKDDRVISKEL